MLYSTKTAEQKRIDLRETLKQGGAQQFLSLIHISEPTRPY